MHEQGAAYQQRPEQDALKTKCADAKNNAEAAQIRCVLAAAAGSSLAAIDTDVAVCLLTAAAADAAVADAATSNGAKAKVAPGAKNQLARQQQRNTQRTR